MKQLSNLCDIFLTKYSKDDIFSSDFYSRIFEYFCQTNKDQNLNITMTDDVMVRDEDLLQSCFPIFQLNGPTLYSRMWSLGAPISDIKLVPEDKLLVCRNLFARTNGLY